MSAHSLSTASWPLGGLTGAVVRWYLPDVDEPTTADGRARIGKLQGMVSVWINLLLFVVKAVLAVLLGSVALWADAVHSLSDVGSSVIIVLGFRWARKPRDSQHPYGHERIELVTALVIAVLLIVTALEFARAGIARIASPPALEAPWWMILLLLGTVGLKHAMTVFARKLSVATRSEALEADYWHHLADLLSTLLVIFALLVTRWGWPSVDGWATIGVAGFILYTGIYMAQKAISPLLGEAPNAEEVHRIAQAARTVRGVRGVHDLMLHRYGEQRVVSLHIEVDAHRSAMEVHDIAECVETAIEAAEGGKAIVHVDPVDRAHPDYARTTRTLQEVVDGDPQISEFHDLRVGGPPHHLHVTVDVVAVVGTDEAQYPDIQERVKQAILAVMADVDGVQVTVETGYHEHPTTSY